MLLVRDDQRLASAILPGFWTHAALYRRHRSDLERLGLNTHPQVIRHEHEFPENPGPLGLVIEALCPCVQFNPLAKCLLVDHVAVLRPTLPSCEIAAAIGEAVGQLRKPYDFEFDFNNTSRIVCTELVYRSLHHRGDIRFVLTKRLGRFTLTGDDIMAHVLDAVRAPAVGTLPPLQPVALLLKRRDGALGGPRTNPAVAASHSSGVLDPSRRVKLPRPGNPAAGAAREGTGGKP